MFSLWELVTTYSFKINASSWLMINHTDYSVLGLWILSLAHYGNLISVLCIQQIKADSPIGGGCMQHGSTRVSALKNKENQKQKKFLSTRVFGLFRAGTFTDWNRVVFFCNQVLGFTDFRVQSIIVPSLVLGHGSLPYHLRTLTLGGPQCISLEVRNPWDLQVFHGAALSSRWSSPVL